MSREIIVSLYVANTYFAYKNYYISNVEKTSKM